MQFSIKENAKKCIIKIHAVDLSAETIFRVKKLMRRVSPQKAIALNLEKIESITPEFLSFIKLCERKQKLSLTETPCEVFAILNLTQYAKFVNMFLTDKDFYEHKRTLIERNFKLVESNIA